MKLKFFILTTALIFSNNTFSATWYVNVNAVANDSYTGTNPNIIPGPGSIGPKKTINAALSIAASGDTVYISDGLYEEILILNKGIVIRGNNWGVNPLSQTRYPETYLTTPMPMLGSNISGNSIIEIFDNKIEIDGIKISGNNPNYFQSITKYNQEFEISYGISGRGAFNNISLSNLIISNFAIAGIHLSSGNFSTPFNKIEKCRISTGDYNSEAIILAENFYTNIYQVNIDSVRNGLTLMNYSDKLNRATSISYLNIKAENRGIGIMDFISNTDSILLQYNVINPVDIAYDFEGFSLINLSSNGYIELSYNSIINATKGLSIKDHNVNCELILANNQFNGGKIGVYIQQSIITQALDLMLNNCQFNNLDSSAIYTLVDGDLLTLNLIDNIISNSRNGLILTGNSFVIPNSTQFSNISSYYFYLDSSSTGLRPINKMDANNCYYNGVLGNNLNKIQGFNVEDKIRHYLDRTKNAWILFKNNTLYVSDRDGNSSLNNAIQIANDFWEIYLDKINSSETAIIDKNIHLFTHPLAEIAKISMQAPGKALYLHGNLILFKGLELKNGFIQTSITDTLKIYRSNVNTLLNPGNSGSYIKGPVYIRYINLPIGYQLTDTVPMGIINDYRPLILNATWQGGMLYSDVGFKSFIGSAPSLNLPANISHGSDIRFWQITNPYNSSVLTFNKIGFEYDTLFINDLVNDPANLRIIYNDNLVNNNLGGVGTTSKKGSIISNTGNPGFGFYTLGNAIGGNNILSPNKPIALIKVNGHCINDSIEISAENSRSDSSIIFWQWSISGPSFVSTPENLISIKKKITAPGNYTITLIIANNKGFLDTTTKVLIIDPTPNFSYSALSPCFPTPILISNKSTQPPFTSISNTEWIINGNTYLTPDLNFTPTVTGPTKGLLTLTLNNGCSDTFSFQITSPAQPSITLIPNGNASICNGDSLKVKINKSTGTVIWNDSKTYDSLTLKTNTFKKATISNSPQCFSSDSINVEILDRPTVNAGIDVKTLPGKPINLKGTSNGMIEWIPDTWLNDALSFTPTSRPLLSTTYILRAYNTLGCEATDTVKVIVIDNEKSTVPNLLTPNGDGHNDTWELSNINDPKNCDVYVFSRDGLLVFSATNYNNKWGGTRDTVLLPDGYYVYVVEHKPSGKVYTGILNILK